LGLRWGTWVVGWPVGGGGGSGQEEEKKDGLTLLGMYCK
jgi:hypothetical protein